MLITSSASVLHQRLHSELHGLVECPVRSYSGHYTCKTVVYASPAWGSTTIRLRTFRLRHFVYRHFIHRHFVYYCIPAYRTVIHPTSVSANHSFHQFQLLLTL